MAVNEGDFFAQLGYIDGITIIDTSGTILFTIKFNPRFNPNVKDSHDIIGRKLFDVFTSVNRNNSTLIKAMELGMPVFKKKQLIQDIIGNNIETTNISLPIKAKGRIIGAIELSRDITCDSTKEGELIQLNSDMFANNGFLKDHIGPDRARYSLEDIISQNKSIKELKSFVKRIADSSAPVFIYGETGTGKELFAHAIHNESNRSKGPFIAQNCAAIPENLLESILFGTTRGSFTGATDSPGLFELAEGGSIFLDEINCMPVHLQSKLLRVLQDGYIRRLGDTRERKVNVRVIAAANRHPRECVREGQLRPDIYYRLCVLVMHIPPLRERKEDIPLLFSYFIDKYNKLLGKRVSSVSREIYKFIGKYSWPGNVRELEHIVEYAMNIIDPAESTVKMEHIEDRVKEIIDIDRRQEGDYIQPLKEVVQQVEKDLISKALEKTGGNVSRAARILEIPRQTLQRKIDRYGIKK